jgi:hypothetical protein
MYENFNFESELSDIQVKFKKSCGKLIKLSNEKFSYQNFLKFQLTFLNFAWTFCEILKQQIEVNCDFLQIHKFQSNFSKNKIEISTLYLNENY